MKPERDYTHETPVNDETFGAFRKLYDYPPAPLQPTVEEASDGNPYWIRQKVSFDAAYDGPRITAFLFLPRGGVPPYQTVVYYPSGIAYMEKSSSHLEMWYLEPLIRDGRAVLYPVLWGMYERKARLKGSAKERSVAATVRSIQDLRRCIDYLETRPDIDLAKLAYFGFSAGAIMAPVALATEPRFRVAEIVVGGLSDAQAPPEIDPFNFAPRARTPVLMMNGRYDLGFPLETSQRPLLNAFGAAKAGKKLVLLEAGHAMVGFPASTRESLDWLDRYLGPVRTRP
jgi:dienelactone hydrolase